MKANCPQCSTSLTVDDAKVPDRAFSLKCPKCQTLVRMPGRQAAAAPAPPAAAPVAPQPAEAAPPPPPTASKVEKPRTAPQAPSHPPAPPGSAGAALVALNRPEDRTTVMPMLVHLGYSVEPAGDVDESYRLLDQGVYCFVVTDYAGEPASLYQRLNGLPPEIRRPVFLMLVGDGFKSGDGTQAWAVLADFVVNRADLAGVHEMLRRTLGERSRLFQPMLEVHEREMAAHR